MALNDNMRIFLGCERKAVNCIKCSPHSTARMMRASPMALGIGSMVLGIGRYDQ